MVNVKMILIFGSLFVDPEFISWNVIEAIMLAEVGKLLIHVAADVLSVHEPDTNVAAFIKKREIWRCDIVLLVHSIGQ